MATPTVEPATHASPRTLPISGGTRRKLSGARMLGAIPLTQTIRLSIYARQNPSTTLERARITHELSAQFPRDRHYLEPNAFERIFGADPADLERVSVWAKTKHLKILDTNAASRRILVEGDVAHVNAAFTITLNEYDHPTLGRFRGREGSVQVDADVYGIIEGVFGLDNRHVGHPRFRRLATTPLPWKSAQTNPWPGTFFPTEVAALYDYPAKLNGAGQNIAVFAFNGGTDGDPHGGYDAAALNTYFTQVLGGSMPTIKDVVLHGPGNFPGPDTKASENRGDATGEVMLDLCIVGAVAPSANIFVYFTEFTTQGWVDAIHAAITDENRIAVISNSYGNPEDDPQGAWTPMGIKLVDQALQAAVAKGITICVASGDDGSSDGEKSGAHVDFPASSSFVLAVGGTKLTAKGNTVKTETVWNEVRHDEGAGGGGVSIIFSKPDYQANTDIPPAADPPHRVGRGLPDVAAVADPFTGVVVMHVNGKHLEPVGGTSASAPLWASLIARLNQGLGARCGFINPLLYTQLNKGVLRDITVGSNGAYSAQVGWDACTGFGAPGGNSLLRALSAHGKKSDKSKTAAPRSAARVTPRPAPGKARKPSNMNQ
jgi:kumamolisin